MNWRAQVAESFALMDESLEQMAVGNYETAISLAREANRLRSEALEWKWTHEPSPPFIAGL